MADIGIILLLKYKPYLMKQNWSHPYFMGIMPFRFIWAMLYWRDPLTNTYNYET